MVFNEEEGHYINNISSPGYMLGTVGFENHRIDCIIGINPKERLHKQEIYVSLQVKSNFAEVALKDDLSYAVNYSTLAAFCTEWAEKKQYHMLETYAYELIHQLVDHFKLSWVKLLVKKPAAIATASYAFVELEYSESR